MLRIFLSNQPKLSDFKLQKEEVSELKYITVQELERLVEKQEDNYLFSKWEYIQEVINY